MITLEQIYRYPVKGLMGEALSEITLNADGGIPCDRQWALAHIASPIKGEAAPWATKQHFLNLSTDPKLIQLQTEFDEASQNLTILRKGRKLCQGKLNDPMGRMLLQNFLTSFLGSGSRSNPSIIQAKTPQDHFYDRQDERLSLINLDSVKDLEQRLVRAPIDPIRFRGNLYISGMKPWQELEMTGKMLKIGNVDFKIGAVIERCAAVNVNPQPGKNLGECDMNIPLALRRGFGHIACGVFITPLSKTDDAKMGDLNPITLRINDPISFYTNPLKS
ncbi:MAG: MOSC domain-containing protein [Alphaproteobacteria bacterium]